MSNQLNKNEFSEIGIIGDGNCFYRCLSMFYEYNQDNYRYYRRIIYEYISNNKNVFIPFFDKYDSESDLQFYERYNKCIEKINNNGVFAGDFELSSASSVLNKNIIVYRLTQDDEYEYIYKFKINTIRTIYV